MPTIGVHAVLLFSLIRSQNIAVPSLPVYLGPLIEFEVIGFSVLIFVQMVSATTFVGNGTSSSVVAVTSTPGTP